MRFGTPWQGAGSEAAIWPSTTEMSTLSWRLFLRVWVPNRSAVNIWYFGVRSPHHGLSDGVVWRLLISFCLSLNIFSELKLNDTLLQRRACLLLLELNTWCVQFNMGVMDRFFSEGWWHVGEAKEVQKFHLYLRNSAWVVCPVVLQQLRLSVQKLYVWGKP